MTTRGPTGKLFLLILIGTESPLSPMVSVGRIVLRMFGMCVGSSRLAVG